jgi:membrane fusion protein, multidrug efflux system
MKINSLKKFNSTIKMKFNHHIMKNIFILLVATGFLYSCSSTEDKSETQSKIEKYRSEINTLNSKIKELETSLGPESIDSPNGLKIKVKTMDAKTEEFSHYFDATGDIEAIDEAYISPEISGQISSISVKEGDYVKKGQLLAKLNSDVIESNIAQMKTQLALSETIFKKQTELWNKQIGSERQYLEAKTNYESLQDQLKALKAQYEMTVITSPINGYIEVINQKEGEYINPGMQFMQIINLDQLYINSKISESYLPVIKKSDIVEVTFSAFPEILLQEPVYRIGNVINPSNRTFLVQLKVNNKSGLLKPNLLATIRINDYNSDNNIIVPTILIKQDMTGSFVYVAEQKDGQWIAQKKYVKTGLSYRDKTEILSGLEVNDKLVTDGYNNVSKGSVLEIVG